MGLLRRFFVRRNAASLATGLLLFNLNMVTTPSARAEESQNNSSNSDDLRLEPKSWEFEDSHVEVLLPPPSQFPFSIEQSKSGIAPTTQVLRKRLQATITNPSIADPLVIRLKSTDVRRLVKQLGNEGAIDAVNESTRSPYLTRLTQQLRPRVREMRLTLVAEDLAWLDLDKLARAVTLATTEPKLNRKNWEKMEDDPDLKSAMEGYFGFRSRSVMHAVNDWLAKNDDDEIPLNLFLPPHMQRYYGQFFPYRGRNCFATALGFADKNVVNRREVNMIREAGHDKAMINSDEFQNALWLGYYELEPEEILDGLKLGDIVVFYEDDDQGYKSFRHAAVHVADTVYFHKPSKSATTPIEFADWSKLVSTWSALTKKLDYKVYRKLPMGMARYQKPATATEKIFWSQ